MATIEEILKKIEDKRLQKLLEESILEQEKFEEYEKRRQLMINEWKIYENIHFNSTVVTGGGGGNGGSHCNFGGSLEFGQDNTLRYLTVDYDSDFNIDENDFTVEWFQYQKYNSEYPRVFQFDTWPSPFGVSVEGDIFYFWNGSSLSAPIPTVTDKWTFFAISRVSGVTRIYLDEQKILESSNSYSINVTGIPMSIGIDLNYSGTTYFTGGITNFHVVNGTGLYDTETITIPTSSIQKVGNTILLLSVSNESGFITDSSGTGKIITNTDVLWNASNPCGEFINIIPY